MAGAPAPFSRRSTDSSFRVWKNSRLSTQLLWVLILCNAPVFLGLHLYDVRATRSQIHALERDTREVLEPLVRGAIERSMVDGTSGHIAGVFEALRKNGTIKHAQLLDSENRVVNTADFLGGGTPGRIEFTLSEEDSEHTSEIAIRSRPACVRCHGSGKKMLGRIRLTTSPSRAHETILRLYTARALMGAAGLLCLILSVYLVVLKMVRDPMRTLLDAMAEIRGGRLETRIRSGGSAEFSRVFDHFNGMVKDIERDRNEIVELHRRQIAHMDRLATVGELAANLAHEVRNPLTGIGSTIQVLMSDPKTDPSRKRIMEKVLGQLDRMDKTMSSFLRYARLPEAVMRPFRVHEPLQRILPILQPRLRAQGIELSVEVPDSLSPVKGDSGQIEQALLNVCINAAQAMPQGGRLSVSARENRGTIRVEVADTGSGIRPENLDNIFKPFYTTREKGSGLGLPLTRQIVMAHGGELTVESVPGSGTSVFLTLPLGGPRARGERRA